MRYSISLVVLLMISVIVSFNSGNQSTELASETTKIIRVAGDNNFPPFEFVKNQTYQGFNVDILNAVSIESGITFEFHPMPWNQAIRALETGEVDAIQGMKFSRERGEIYQFSEPYFTSSQAIFVLKDNYTITSLKDLKGHRISVQKSDISSTTLNDIHDVNISYKENQEAAIQLLLDGQVDAFVGNQITGQYVLQKNGQQDRVKIVGDPISPTDYGMVVLKNNKELLEPIDKALRQMKKNDTYNKIERKWFGEFIYPATSNLKNLLAYVIGGLGLVFIVLLIFLWWNFSLKRELKKQMNDYTRTLDELARKDRLQSLGQLVAGIAHEIRNPITAILSYSQLLPKKYDNPEYREFFAKHVSEEVQRLDKIVNELLDFSRQKPPEKCRFRLQETVESVILFFHSILKDKSITVKVDMEDSLLIWADQQQIKQVFINLIKNAIDAMHLGGQIFIKADKRQDDVFIEIVDDGEGIDAEDLKRIFEPFFTKKTNGVGLGLSICYQLIMENSGTIEVQSERGIGTRIKISLLCG